VRSCTCCYGHEVLVFRGIQARYFQGAFQDSAVTLEPPSRGIRVCSQFTSFFVLNPDETPLLPTGCWCASLIATAITFRRVEQLVIGLPLSALTVNILAFSAEDGRNGIYSRMRWKRTSQRMWHMSSTLCVAHYRCCFCWTKLGHSGLSFDGCTNTDSPPINIVCPRDERLSIQSRVLELYNALSAVILRYHGALGHSSERRIIVFKILLRKLN